MQIRYCTVLHRLWVPEAHDFPKLDGAFVN
jgi:hypothetical protein